MSAITSKAQTTRNRILGIVNTEAYQIIYSDTPGKIATPAYKLQKLMNDFVDKAFEDGDVLVFVTDKYEVYEENDEFIQKLKNTDCPIIIVLNKIDLYTQEEVETLFKYWSDLFPKAQIHVISAKENQGVNSLVDSIVHLLPVSPPYYDKDTLTDKPEKFFVSEIIREKIFLNYEKEIPYCTQVVIESFEDGDKLTKIRAIILVERQSQVSIIVGVGGNKLKKVGTESREEIEKFLDKKVFLETKVKVKENWRNDLSTLKNFGYTD